MRRCRENLPNRCCHLTSRVARCAFEGVQAANRKGRAAMTSKTYCGNLLWQSGLTLLAPDFSSIRGNPVPQSASLRLDDCRRPRTLVYVSDSGPRDNGFEREARAILFGDDSQNHSFVDEGTFNPNGLLNNCECIKTLTVAMHGNTTVSKSGPRSIVYWGRSTLYESLHEGDISFMFIGIKFCRNGCLLELRSCNLGNNPLLADRIARITGCSVLLHKYKVYADGSEEWPWWKWW